MHRYVTEIYRVTKDFPGYELYGVTSQIRRSSVSIILNYIEGFARRNGENCKTYANFLRISYGSLKESKYLLFLALELNYISKENYTILLNLSDKIGKMLWPLFN